MLEEIRQQPAALERTLSSEMRNVERFRRQMEKRRPRFLVLVARGTSDNAATFGRYLLEITTGIPVSLAAPSVTTLYDARLDLREALVVAISQSGESTDTNLVLERARDTFRRGHRIMVQIQSTWFPLTDRNPQKFVDISKATEADFQKATEKIYFGGSQASNLVLPVLK